MGNQYLVEFVDHKSNYCRVFLAHQAAKKLSIFWRFLKCIKSCSSNWRWRRVQKCGSPLQVGWRTETCQWCANSSVQWHGWSYAPNGVECGALHDICEQPPANLLGWYGGEFVAHFKSQSYKLEPNRASPIKVLKEQAPELRDIVLCQCIATQRRICSHMERKLAQLSGAVTISRVTVSIFAKTTFFIASKI